MRVRKERGYTLVELLIVVAILAMAAAIAVPSDSPSLHQTLNLAASQVADAMRFAREESRRTGMIHGVSVDLTNHELQVFRLDEGPNPNLKIFDVYQPVSKQIYTIELGESPYRGVTLSAVGGNFTGACNDPESISFDSAGVVRCVEPVATRIRDASVELTLGSLKKDVTVESYTGRISVQ